MYCNCKLFFKCQCCQQRVALPDPHSPSDLLGDDDPAEVVDASDDTCCFHSRMLLFFWNFAVCCMGSICIAWEIIQERAVTKDQMRRQTHLILFAKRPRAALTRAVHRPCTHAILREHAFISSRSTACTFSRSRRDTARSCSALAFYRRCCPAVSSALQGASRACHR